MKFKGILLDIDNCLYKYETSHNAALLSTIQYLHSKLKIDQDVLAGYYAQARQQIHGELSGTGSSHNRLLYFQRMLEIAKCNPVQYALEVYERYWNTFIENIVLYDGVEDFFSYLRNKKIGFVTDLTTDIQHKKILKLNLTNHVSCIVTSEEAGCEKPESHIFLLALEKLKLKPQDVCMIGDDYERDIVGARLVGMHAIWLNSEGDNKEISDKSINQFNNFREIAEFFKNE